MGKDTDDGYKYRGSGFIHLTGRANYTAFAEAMGDMEIINQGADYVAQNYAWEAAAYYWANRVKNKFENSATPSVKEITKAVNGGTTNLKERTDAYNLLVSIFGE